MWGLVALVLLQAPPDPIPATLPPVELCAAEPGFAEFRSRLKQVVAERDERALLAMLSADVQVNFGGDHGPALFAANWKFSGPDPSSVWAELADALALGCAKSGDALIAPPFVAQLPHGLDAFETVILKPGTPLRTAKSESADGMEAMDWHLASVTDDRDEAWLAVKLVDGRQGFVRRDQTVNPLDYRLVFEKRGGVWLITAFVAGD